MTTRQQEIVLADTNVVSYIHRNDPEGRPYLARMTGCRAAISFQTHEELLFGVLKNNWGQRRIDDLFEYVSANYDMVRYDLELVRASARLRVESERRGRQLSTADAWIAATAILLGCPLLSHDKDFGNPPNLRVIRYPYP